MDAIFVNYSDEEIWKANKKPPLYLKKKKQKKKKSIFLKMRVKENSSEFYSTFLFKTLIYYMASSASGQDESNPAL